MAYPGPTFPGDAGLGGSYVAGTGSASTLSMSEEQMKAAAEREQEREPLGFQPKEEKR